MSDTRPNLRISREISLPGDFLSVVRDVESDVLFVGNSTGKIYRLDLSRGEDPFPRVIDAHVSYVSSLVVAGTYLISAGSDHRLVWWNRTTHAKVREAEGHAKWIRKIALSPDSSIVASVCDDLVVRLFDAQSAQLIRELHGGHDIHNLLDSGLREAKGKPPPFGLLSKLYDCVFSPDGKHLATSDLTGRVVVWEVSSGKQLTKVEAELFATWDTNGHTYGGIRSIDFSPDGTLLASGGNLCGDSSTVAGSKSMLQVHKWATGEKTHDFRVGGNFFYERIKFHHGGNMVLAAAGAGSDHKLVFFDLDKKEIAYEVKIGMITRDIEVSRETDTIYVVGRRGAVNVGSKGTLVKWVTQRVKRV